MSDERSIRERVLEQPVLSILERNQPKKKKRSKARTVAEYGSNMGLGALLGGSFGVPLGALSGGAYATYKMGKGKTVPRNIRDAIKQVKRAPSAKSIASTIGRDAKRGAAAGGTATALLGALMGAQIARALTKESAPRAQGPQSHITPQSSNVKGYTYDAKGKSMYVTFKNGSTYRYDNVDPATYKSFRRSKSTGKAVNRRLKTPNLPYTKVAWEQTGPPPHHTTKGDKGGDNFIAEKVPMPIPGMLRERIREGAKKEIRKTASVVFSRHNEPGTGMRIDAHVDGKNIGYSTYRKGDDGGYVLLEGLYVKPEYRRQGLGKKLIEKAMGENKGKEVRVRARPFKDAGVSKDKLEGFYRSLGFTGTDDKGRLVKTAAHNLFHNIRQKRARGGKPAKPGDKSYPDEKTWKKVTKTAAAMRLRAEHKDPAGGLTAKGRAYYNKRGSNLKPGVTGKADTPEKLRRKGSFLSRMFGPGAKGSMQKPDGKPTRRALSAAAWGEPVPKDDQDRARLYAKGQSLLERYKQTKTASEGAATIAGGAAGALLGQPAAWLGAGGLVTAAEKMDRRRLEKKLGKKWKDMSIWQQAGLERTPRTQKMLRTADKWGSTFWPSTADDHWRSKSQTLKGGLAGGILGMMLARHFAKKKKEAKTEKTAADEKDLARMQASIKSFLKAQGLPEDSPHMMMAGSALYAHGLRDKFDDIDLAVPGIKKRTKEFHGGIEIDAGPQFVIGGKDRTKQMIGRAQRHPSGVMVMHPKDILRHKQEMNRPKDQKDIAVLKEHLKTSSPKIQCRVCKWSWKADESTAKEMFNCHKCGGEKTGAMIK